MFGWWTFQSGEAGDSYDWIADVLNGLGVSQIILDIVATSDRVCTVTLGAEFDGEDRLGDAAAAFVYAEGELGFDGRKIPAPAVVDENTWAFLDVTESRRMLPSGKAFGLMLPLAEAATTAFEMAARGGFAIRYSVRLEYTEGSREAARFLVPALAEVELRYPTIPKLQAALRETYATVQSAGWIAHTEQIGMAANDVTLKGDWLERYVRNSLSARYPFLSVEDFETRWTHDRNGQLKNAHVEAVCGARRPPNYLEQLLQIRGSKKHGPLSRRVKPVSPVSPASSDQFLFLSYSHRNPNLARLVARVLSEHQTRFWIDDGIEGGTLWDDVIEERIRHSSGMIACVSDDYQRSKICRREIKFADHLDKPIIPVASDNYLWGDNLQFMFQNLQILRAQDDAFLAKFLHTLRSSAPGCFV